MALRFGAFLLIGVALSAQERPVGKGVNFYNREKEAGLGAQLAAETRRTTTAVESAQIRGYLDRLGRQLSAQVPNLTFPYTITVVAEDMGSRREPLALPAGYIFIPANLIVASRDQTEFARLLAHAMAHIAERHGTRLATRGELANAASTPLIFMGAMSDSRTVPIGFRGFMEKFEAEANALADKIVSTATLDPPGDEFIRIQEELRRLIAMKAPRSPSLLRPNEPAR